MDIADRIVSASVRHEGARCARLGTEKFLMVLNMDG